MLASIDTKLTLNGPATVTFPYLGSDYTLTFYPGAALDLPPLMVYALEAAFEGSTLPGPAPTVGAGYFGSRGRRAERRRMI